MVLGFRSWYLNVPPALTNFGIWTISARPTPMSTLGHMLNRVPPGLFRDGAKIGAPDVNELLPAALQIASNNKKQVHATAKFNAE